jgi:hypothetical protein
MNYLLLITAHEAAERHHPMVNGHADINCVEVRVPAQPVLDITLDVSESLMSSTPALPSAAAARRLQQNH